MSFTVLDLFCGAGGFSQGFYQAGYKIDMGIDNWKPAVDTYKANFPDAEVLLKDISKLSLEEIEELPRTNIIIGSPPCQSFSMSNKGGKADKTEGKELLKSFFRVVAVKMHQGNIDAWFMENVPNVKKEMPRGYSYRDLDLVEFAKREEINPDDIAVTSGTEMSIDSVDFGVAQKRKRAFYGEVIRNKSFPDLTKYKKKGKSLKKLFNRFPLSFDSLQEKPGYLYWDKNKFIEDPNYNEYKFHFKGISDHFYDSRMYKMKWLDCKIKKQEHPFAGKLDFPENFDKPSRTVICTSGHARETLVYTANRLGGSFQKAQYREPTIRELMCIMSFPLSYQLEGTLNQKRTMVGNAVCPLVANAIASAVLDEFNETPSKRYRSNFDLCLTNLNSDKPIKFDSLPVRKKGAKFRRLMHKKDNVSINLTNYDLLNKGDVDGKWYFSLFLGYDLKKHIPIDENRFKIIEDYIFNQYEGGRFVKEVNEFLKDCRSKSEDIQRVYENPYTGDERLDPNNFLFFHLSFLSEEYSESYYYHEFDFIGKKLWEPQIFSIYALSKLVKAINSGSI